MWTNTICQNVKMSRIIDRQTYVKEITILTGEFHNYRDRFWQHCFLWKRQLLHRIDLKTVKWGSTIPFSVGNANSYRIVSPNSLSYLPPPIRGTIQKTRWMRGLSLSHFVHRSCPLPSSVYETQNDNRRNWVSRKQREYKTVTLTWDLPSWWRQFRPSTCSFPPPSSSTASPQST